MCPGQYPLSTSPLLAPTMGNTFHADQTCTFLLIHAAACLQMPAPAFGLLRARLDIKDAVLDLERAVQSSLRLYEATADREGASESEGSDQVIRPHIDRPAQWDELAELQNLM